MNRRAALLAVVMGLLSVVTLVMFMRQFERETSGGERIRLLMTNKPIGRGELISDDMLTTRDVPTAYVEDRAIRAGDRAKVIGVRTTTSLQAQVLVMWSDLALDTEERDLSDLVQPGSRAVTVRAASEDSVGNSLIRPGDYVDVLVTMGDPSKGAVTEARSSVVLLQKLLVLAVGSDTTPQSGSGAAGQAANQPPRTDWALTLSLNLQEAQMLALGSEKGRLSVALRNPHDQRVVEQVPDMASAALFDNKVRVAIQGARKAGPTRLVEPSGSLP